MGLLTEPSTGEIGMTTKGGPGDSARVGVDAALCLLGALGLCVAWGLWPNLVSMARKWSHDPRYSHGMLVPLFAAVLWKLRMPEGTTRAGRANWWGLAFVWQSIDCRGATTNASTTTTTSTSTSGVH